MLCDNTFMNYQNKSFEEMAANRFWSNSACCKRNKEPGSQSLCRIPFSVETRWDAPLPICPADKRSLESSALKKLTEDTYCNTRMYPT